VLPYLPAGEVERLLARLIGRFDGGELALDAVSRSSGSPATGSDQPPLLPTKAVAKPHQI